VDVSIGAFNLNCEARQLLINQRCGGESACRRETY
jgi:hypothetical protein